MTNTESLPQTEKFAQYLEAGESFGEPFGEGESIIYPVHKQGRSDTDRILYDIHGESPKVALIDGNPLNVEVISGFGQVTMIELDTGTKVSTVMIPGDKVQIEPGVLYWYEAEDEMLVRDTCYEFNPANEPLAEDFIGKLGAVMLDKILK